MSKIKNIILFITLIICAQIAINTKGLKKTSEHFKEAAKATAPAITKIAAPSSPATPTPNRGFAETAATPKFKTIEEYTNSLTPERLHERYLQAKRNYIKCIKANKPKPKTKKSYWDMNERERAQRAHARKNELKRPAVIAPPKPDPAILIAAAKKREANMTAEQKKHRFIYIRQRYIDCMARANKPKTKKKSIWDMTPEERAKRAKRSG